MTPEIRRAIGFLFLAAPIFAIGAVQPHESGFGMLLKVIGGWMALFAIVGIGLHLIRGPKTADEIDAPQPH